MAAKSVGAFVITEDPMLIYNVSTSATLALQHRLAGCGFPEFARAGGFVGYGVDFPELWRHAATFVDKILKGTNPANIPVERLLAKLASVADRMGRMCDSTKHQIATGSSAKTCLHISGY
jgi:ABC-type uncharacterized transport system substrate-binding protein